MPSILYRMPSGVPGAISRLAGARTEAVFIGANGIPYGAPVQLDASGNLVPATDEAKSIYGFLVRPYPTQADSEADNSSGVGAGKAGSVGDVLRSGYMSVRIASTDVSAAKKGAAVKVVFTAEAGFAVGDISSTKGKDVPGCTFVGGADASGNAEIAFNI